MGMQPNRTCFGGPKQSMAMQIAINASDEHVNADAIKQHTCQTWRDSMCKHKSHNNIFGEESMQRRPALEVQGRVCEQTALAAHKMMNSQSEMQMRASIEMYPSENTNKQNATSQ